MSLYSSTPRHVTPLQLLPVAAGEPDPCFPCRTNSRFKVWDCHELHAPPPSPRCISQRAFEPMDLNQLDQQFEAYKSTPLRRVVSADDASEIDEHKTEEFDGEADDDATMVAASNAPSSRCSDTTLFSEIGSTRRRFRLPSRADRQQRPSTSAGRNSQASSSNWDRQISAPVFDSSTVSPDIAASSSKFSLRMGKFHSESGHFRPMRPSPEIPGLEVRSRWSESDDGKGKKREDASEPVRSATFPGRGKRFRSRLSDLFCTS